MENTNPDDTTVTVTFMENATALGYSNDYTDLVLTLQKDTAIGTFELQPYIWQGNGYDCLGWSTTQYGTFPADGDIDAEFYDFSQPVTEDLTLYAVWQSTGSTEELKERYSTVEATEHPDWVQQALYTYDVVTIYAADESNTSFDLKNAELTIPSEKILELRAGAAEGGSPNVSLAVSGSILRNLGTIEGDLTIGGSDDSYGAAYLYDGDVTGTVTLNGGDLTVSGGTVDNVTQNSGILTITDGDVSSITQNSGTLTISSGRIGIVMNHGDEFTITGGHVSSVIQDSGDFFITGGTVNNVTQTGGALYVDGGTIGVQSAPQALQRSAVDCGLNLSGGTAYLDGGTIYSAYQGNGNMNMSGGTVENGYEITGGTLSVSGGTISGDNYSAITMNGGTVTISGDAIVRSSADGVIEYTGGDLNLEGGTVWSSRNYGFAIVSPEGTIPSAQFDDGAMFIIGTAEASGDDIPVSLGTYDNEAELYNKEIDDYTIDRIIYDPDTSKLTFKIHHDEPYFWVSGTDTVKPPDRLFDEKFWIIRLPS